jgi:RNA polymerase sigma-70 factor, ECF subfamily
MFCVSEESVLTESPETATAGLACDVGQIYRQTRSAVYSYVRYLGVPDAQAQEVTQEVYLRLYQTMRKKEEIVSVRAWLFRVAHNLAIRVRTRERIFHPTTPDWERFTESTVESAEHKMLTRERVQRLESALKTLSPQQRNCLYLRSEGLRYREIADVMGISTSSVNEFLRRAISRLAESANA